MCSLAQARISGEQRFGHAGVIRSLRPDSLDHAAGGQLDRDVEPEIEGGDDEVRPARSSRGGHDTDRRPVPGGPDRVEVRVRGQ